MNGTDQRTDVGKIVADVQTLARGFEEIQWQHVRKESNSLAHHLAKDVSVHDEAHWIATYPPEVARVVYMDQLMIEMV